MPFLSKGLNLNFMFVLKSNPRFFCKLLIANFSASTTSAMIALFLLLDWLLSEVASDVFCDKLIDDVSAVSSASISSTSPRNFILCSSGRALENEETKCFSSL